jgi:molybdate transport system ATP-binding protein
VALARALATEPALLLLDEPLAAVDAAARAELRPLLREQLRQVGGARLLVTHDPVDAAALADEVVVLEEGRVAQRGPLAEVTARPTSAWVASMVGLNLLAGAASGLEVRLDAGGVLHVAVPAQGRVLVAFRPNAVTVHRTEPEGSARNTWPAQVAEVWATGGTARVRLTGPVPLVAEVTTDAVAALDLAHAGQVWAAVKATELDVYGA